MITFLQCLCSAIVGYGIGYFVRIIVEQIRWNKSGAPAVSRAVKMAYIQGVSDCQAGTVQTVVVETSN